MPKQSMRFCLLFLFLFAFLSVSVYAERAADDKRIIRDDELIIRAVASSYPDADFGAKTALCAVILNRLADSGYPDTVPGVICAAGSGFDPRTLMSVRDEKVLRITRDACSAVRAGANPIGGLLCFDILPKPGRKDNRADFSASLDLTKYRVVIGNIGFY